MNQNLLFALLEELKESNRVLISSQSELLSEINDIRKENAAISEKLDKLQEDLSQWDKLDFSLKSPYDVPASLKEVGVFSDMLYPQRCHSDPRDEDGQRRQFGWGLYKQLAWDVLGPSAKRLSIEDLGICIDNVRRSHMINSVIDRVNKEHDIDENTTWGSLSLRAQNSAALYLEELAAPHLPLRACVGNWGAKMMLRKFWNNGLQDSKQTSNDNTNSSKSDHAVLDHTADFLQSIPRSQFNTFAPQNMPLDHLMGSETYRHIDGSVNSMLAIDSFRQPFTESPYLTATSRHVNPLIPGCDNEGPSKKDKKSYRKSRKVLSGKSGVKKSRGISLNNTIGKYQLKQMFMILIMYCLIKIPIKRCQLESNVLIKERNAPHTIPKFINVFKPCPSK
ncbi:hypothetical protein F4703DRAFT_1855771 [Phycomyces blakesleeanus]